MTCTFAASTTSHRRSPTAPRSSSVITSIGIAAAEPILERLRAHPEFGVQVVGYLDDRRPAGERIEGKEVLGGYEAVTRILGDQDVDQLFVALPMDAHHETLKILNAIEGELTSRM